MKIFGKIAIAGAPLSLLIISLGQPAQAQSSDRCDVIAASIENAGFADEVSVNCNRGHAHIHSDTYPGHQLMTGIVGTNEQVPVPAKDYSAPIPLLPSLGTTPQTRDASLGIAVNGVPIYDYTGGGEMTDADLYHHQTRHDTILTRQLDTCGGHAGRGDDYHYHASPTCMIAQMENAGDNAIIGWAFDGFPIFGDNNPDGSSIAASTLDVCNGQPDPNFGYRYHTSDAAPYIIQCLMGEIDNLGALPRVTPLKAAIGGPGQESGRPPRGGVNGLVFTEYGSGLRSMDYTYEGQAYYIRYAPSNTPNCYNFETRTVTNNGAVKAGEYCR